MVIEVTFDVTDVYISTTVSPVYVNVSFEAPSGSGGTWGSITGTLSNQTDLQNALNAKFDDPTGTTAQYLRGDGSLATFPSLTGYVPYTGATSDVDLGEYQLRAGQLTLDTSPTGTAAVGTTRWNDTIGSSETTLKGGNVILKNGVDLVARVVNKVSPNTTLTKAAYQAVRVSGAQGQRLAVAFAQANNDNNSADTIGLVIETIPTNQEGFIMTVGQIEGINTTGSLQGETWSDGDIIYLSPTVAGAVTNVKPSGGQHLVIIGYVEYAHANNGKLYIKISNGWELTELHDTDIVSPANNQGLFYESSSALWKNKSISTVLGYTPEQPLTFNSPLSRSVNAVSIPQATGSVNGFLSATDWTTFNSKQNALGYTAANAATTLTINGVTFDLSANRTFTVGSVTGSGASGQVAYWTGTSAQSGSSTFLWNAASNLLRVNGGIGINRDAFGGRALDVTGGGIRLTGSTSGSFEVNGSNSNFNVSTTGGIVGVNITDTNNARLSLTGNSYNYEIQANTTSFKIRDITATNADRLLIYSTGNVGINTSSDTGERLQVQGTTLLNGNVTFSSSTGMFWDSTNSRLGIGTNAPSTTLDVRGKARIETSSTTELDLIAGGGNILRIACAATTPFIGTLTNAPLGFFTSATERARVSTNGNLLVGSTTDSGERLQVTGNAKIVGNVSFGGVASVNNSITLTSPDANSSIINFASSTVAQIGAFLCSGPSVVYGTYEQRQLNLVSAASGGIGFRTTNLSNGHIRFYAGNANSDFSSEVVRIVSTNGNLILQNGGTFTDVASSRLTINSTTQGFLPPRMTNAQRTAISSPAVGLIVYCTDATEGLYVHKSTGWTFVI